MPRNCDCPTCFDSGEIGIFFRKPCPDCLGKPHEFGKWSLIRDEQVRKRQNEYDPASYSQFIRDCKGTPPPPPREGETAEAYEKRTGIRLPKLRG